MNKNNIELYICNNYNEYTDMCKNFVKDNSLFEADKTARFYFTFSENSDNARFFLLVDNKENKVLTYSFIESDHDETTNISSEDCLYIDFIHTPLSKNTQKGYASLMLDYIFDYARAKGYQKVHLMALGRNPRYLYYKKGFINDSHPNKISVSMYKILDQNDWACSVLISEALNNSNQHTSPSQTLKNIIKYKQYDNMFEFGVMEENEYGNKKTNPVEVFAKWDKFASNLYLTNPIVKKFREIFSTPTVGKADYIQKMTLFESSFADNASESKHLNNVVDGLNLLRISEKFENQKKKTVQRREQQKQRQQQKKDMLNKRLSKRVNKTSQIFVK